MPIFAIINSPNMFKMVFIDLITWLFGIFCPLLAIFTFLSVIKSKKLSLQGIYNFLNNLYIMALIIFLSLFAFGYLILIISFDIQNQNKKQLKHVNDLIFQTDICSDSSLLELLAQHLLLN